MYTDSAILFKNTVLAPTVLYSTVVLDKGQLGVWNPLEPIVGVGIVYNRERDLRPIKESLCKPGESEGKYPIGINEI